MTDTKKAAADEAQQSATPKTARRAARKKPAKMPRPGEVTFLERLRVNELLVDLDTEIYDAFAARCTVATYGANDVVVQEGDSQDSTFFVLDGVVRIILGTTDGFDVNFSDIGAGGWFGEVAAIDKGVRSASVYALDEVTLAVAPSAVFLNLILENRTLALKILRSMTEALRHSNQRISKISSFSGIQRVYLELMRMSEPSGSGDGTWQITAVPSHDAMAEHATTSKEMVARAMSQLFQLRVAKREFGRLKILDRDHLKRLATQS